ncbi:hypothetical protein HPB49_005121 [Dermacentor silvarum]|uniref:Uncharacterized protein n=1 Tax=Dermacentor silvarum TaxID=543639 RepID=A0ACB8DV33_DERSI|nr:hypothetical protein HPB49_005121 [Dermacentor silvarum]
MMAANTKKRTTLTFAAKLEVIQRVENGEKKASVAEAFDIPRSTPSTLLKNKSDIKAKAEQNQHSGVRRVHKVAFEDVEKSLHKWFVDARVRNIPLSGPILQQKARTSHSFSAPRTSMPVAVGCNVLGPTSTLSGRQSPGKVRMPMTERSRSGLNKSGPRFSPSIS